MKRLFLIDKRLNRQYNWNKIENLLVYEGSITMRLKKGFTLVELLGVIVILSILGLIAVTAIDSNLKESRYDTCMVQRNNLIDAAKMVTIDYPDILPEVSSSTIISVQVLHDGGEIDGQVIKGGYIEDEFVNPMTDKPYADGDSVVITTSNGSDFEYTVSFANPDEAFAANLPDSIPNIKERIAHKTNSMPILYTIFISPP